MSKKDDTSSNEELVQNFLKKNKHNLNKFDLIIHTATVLPFKGKKKDLYETNIVSSLNLIKHVSNLDSVFLGCKYALPLMRDSGNGSIINISSMSGIVASHNMSAYNSSKAAVRHLSKSVALHCAKSTNTVRCNSIHPVFTRTAMVQSMIDSAPDRNIEEKLVKQIPLRKLAEPIDIANAALFLASDESSFITGTELIVDGGLSAT